MVSLTTFALILGFALHTAPIPAPSDDPHPRRVVQRPGKTAFWFIAGGSRFNQTFDINGDPSDIGATLSRVNFYAGAAHEVYANQRLGFSLGATVGYARAGVEDQVDHSGLQSALLFAEMKASQVSFRTGYHFDLGPALLGDDLPLSDRQNAVMLGLAGNFPVSTLTFFGRVDTHLTLSNTEEGRNSQNQPADFTYDQGNHFLFSTGVSYAFTSAEVGMALHYRYRTKGTFTLPDGDDTTNESGHHLSIIPYVVFSPVQLPLELQAKLAVQDEYGDFGIALAGINTVVTRAALTLSAVFSL